ncbi:hypothetical protein SAMN02745111_02461 [Eubacterium uniforme]|uniref:Uncharacterized protein n=1 Tax=Eubacterium uniforme TaxID=39495 RepID=A0A1T4W8X1_9FIRM|nr:DUF5688 family protein [Eubacterium uniforme]SKA73445.1 hypothetical protein SAMN02745111_02461 [Eubacterium uniforme]
MDEKKLEYDVFIEYIREHILEYFPEGYANAEVTIKDVLKNNDNRRKGLFINVDKNISPIIYLDDLYESYKNNESLEMGNICRIIYDTYKSQEPDFIVPDVKNFDAVKDKIVFKLINTENNKEFLKDVPSIQHLDMSAVFQIQLSPEASIKVTDNIFNMWNISKDELGKIALENTKRIKQPKLVDMNSMLNEILGFVAFEKSSNPEVNLDSIAEADLKEFFDDNIMNNMTIPLFVLISEDKVNGATCMLFEDDMKKIANALDKNFYIIPSSIHELIIIPDSELLDPMEIKPMISEVNSTCVELTDKLSDNLYKFDKEEMKLKIVKTEEAPKLDQKLEEDIRRNVSNPNQGKSR